MLGSWVVEKLESVSECPRIVLRDPLQLLTGEEARLDAFAKKHGFIVIPAPTNLILRQLMEVAATEHGASKLLLWDKARSAVGANGQQSGVASLPRLPGIDPT